MSTINDGGPAFPPNAGWRDNDPAFHGMSLRDWLAGLALNGMVGIELQAPSMRSEEEMVAYMESAVTERAEWAYRYADAMLKARETGR